MYKIDALLEVLKKINLVQVDIFDFNDFKIVIFF